MSEPSTGSRASLPLPARLWIEKVCTDFEDACKDGQQPGIEAYLGTPPEPERSALLRGLLGLDLAYRRRSGQRPTVEVMPS